VQIDSALLKIKNIDAKIQGMLLKNEENWISISSVTNIQHRWKIKMAQLKPETQLMLINAILTHREKISPSVWAGLPMTENQLIAFITCKEDEDSNNDNHKSILEMYRYLDDIVNNYSAAITPAMKEHIIKMFPTPLDKPVPSGDELTTSSAKGAGLYMHELELLLKLFSPQELRQRFPNASSNIWNTNQDMCDIISKRAYIITVKEERKGTEYTFKAMQVQYCYIVTEDHEQINITDLKVGETILASKAKPEDIDDFESSSYYKDDIQKSHNNRFKIISITHE
jgi:hypothetical protein